MKIQITGQSTEAASGLAQVKAAILLIKTQNMIAQTVLNQK